MMKKRGKWDSSSDEDKDGDRDGDNNINGNDKNGSTSAILKKKTKTMNNIEIPNISQIKVIPSDISRNKSIDMTTKTDIKEKERNSGDNVIKINQVLSLFEYNDDNDDDDDDENETNSSSKCKNAGNKNETDQRVDDSDSIPHKTLSRPHIPLYDGCRSVDEYIRLNFISQGTYGVVFRAKCRQNHKIYALKQVKIGAEANKVGFMLTALRETNILLAMNHPNIMKVREMVVGSTIDKIFMVMEYADNDLKYCLDQSSHPFSTAEVKQLLLQLLSAMSYMHSHWIIHRDLKPSNLLYSNSGRLTVCDFGMARKYDSPVKPYTREVVTLWYRCPELLLGASTYSTPMDIWSIGCILAEMLSTKPLFPGEGEMDQISKIFQMIGVPSEEKWIGFSKLAHASRVTNRIPQKGKLKETFPSTSFSGGPSLNESGFDLLTKLLYPDPNQRISATQALEHPWLQSDLPIPTALNQMPTFRSRHESD